MNFKRIMVYFMVAITVTLISLFNTTISNADSEVMFNQLNKVYYSIERDISNQHKNVEDHQSDGQIIENFTINFFTDDDSQELKTKYNNKKIYELTLNNGEITNNVVSFYPKNLFPDSLIDEKVDLKVFPDESAVDALRKALEKGNEFIPRSISTNYFLDSNPTHRESQSFGVIRSSIYVYDEYNSNRTRKGHFYQGYHNRTDGSPLTRPAWGGTTNFDDTPDTIALAWSIGGAIGLNDSSTQLNINYNFASPSPKYATLTKDSSSVSRHDTLFTGTSIGYNIPDYVKSGLDALFPATQRIQSNTGWYNVGSYEGASGQVRTELFHTYYNVGVIIRPNISTSSVDFSVDNSRDDKVDKMWVYGTVDPN